MSNTTVVNEADAANDLEEHDAAVTVSEKDLLVTKDASKPGNEDLVNNLLNDIDCLLEERNCTNTTMTSYSDNVLEENWCSQCEVMKNDRNSAIELLKVHDEEMEEKEGEIIELL